MLPAVESSINGPLAGPDQRQSYTEHRQSDGSARVGRGPKRDPCLRARRNHAGDGRPQTGNQQDTGERSDQLRWRNRGLGRCDQAIDQSSAGQQSLEQKPSARRTVREHGEQPLHMYPVFSLR